MAKRLTTLARTLRKNSTDAERLLWQRLRKWQVEGTKFRRQQPIDGFIVDFVSFEKRIVIELDGGQHAMNRQKDIERDQSFSQSGFKVMRFWNSDVLNNTDGVLKIIREACLR